MRRLRLLCSVLLGVAGGLLFSAQAFGVTTEITAPTATYLAQTAKIDFSSLPTGTVVSSLSDGVNQVFFDTTVTVATVPSGGWATWSSPPYSESATPAVLKTGDTTSLNLQLGRPVAEFGFELEPNSGTPTQTVTFKLYLGGSVLKTITKSMDWSGGARLFAIKSTTSFSRIEISSTTSTFALAQLRYALPTALTKPTVSPSRPRRGVNTTFRSYLTPVQAAAGGTASLKLYRRETKRVRMTVHGHRRWVRVAYWHLRKTVSMSVNASTGRLSAKTKLTLRGSWLARTSHSGIAGYVAVTSVAKTFRVR